MAALVNAGAAAAGGAGSTIVMSLGLSQPGTGLPKLQRFRGSVRFAAPRDWHGKYSRSDNGLATFNITLASHCTARAYVSSLSTATKQGPLAQLTAELPGASQPGTPVPGPVRTLAGGPLNHGSGRWALVAPPASAQQAFTFYGATLLKVTRARWAGLTIGFVAPVECLTMPPQRAAIVVELAHLLRSATVHDAHIVSI